MVNEFETLVGALDLTGKTAPAGELFRLRAMVRDATFGDPEAVSRSLASQLLDGVVVKDGAFGNRTAVLRVRVEGPNSAVRQRGAKALALWAQSPTTLTWTPPDGIGATTVFRVVRASLLWEFDLPLEVNEGAQVYVLTMECTPFGFSAAAVRDAAPVYGAGSDQSVNTCDSLTGWTGEAGTSVATDAVVKFEGSASIKMTPYSSTFEAVDGGARARIVQVGRAKLSGLALSTPATRPYFTFKTYTRDSYSVTPSLYVNGVPAARLAPIVANDSWTTWVFRTEVTATVTELRFEIEQVGVFPGPPESPAIPATWFPRVDEIRRTGTPPTTIARQSLREVAVRGSARTQGSLAVEHETLGLGDVLVYAHPALGSGYSPSLMPWVTPTAYVVNDSTSMSGKKLSSFIVAGEFVFPVGSLPRGAYQLLGYGVLNEVSSPASQIEVTVTTKINGVTVGSRTYRKAIPEAQLSDTGRRFYPGSVPIYLPDVDVPPGSIATVTLTYQPQTAAGVYADGTLDELFLLAMDDDTSLVCVSAGDHTRLWIDSATLERPTPSVWVGSQADRTDAFHAGALTRSFDVLRLQPPSTIVHVANSGGALPAISLTHVPAHLHLADE